MLVFIVLLFEFRSLAAPVAILSSAMLYDFNWISSVRDVGIVVGVPARRLDRSWF